MKRLWIALLLCSCLHAHEESNALATSIQSIIRESADHKKIDFSYMAFLTDADIQTFAQRSPNLTHLGLAFCSGLTDASLEALATYCPLLEELNLAGCVNITDAGFINFASRSTKLKKLDLSFLSKLTDESLKAIGEHCAQMEVIAVRGNSFSDAGVQFFASKCPQLKEVRLLISPHFQYSIVISEDSIKALAQHSPQLEVLKLDIRSPEKWSFLSGPTFPELRRLEAKNITDDNFALLAKGCPKLEKVTLSDCDELSDDALEALNDCPGIVSLKLEECDEISSSGLCSFIEKHPLLKEVDLAKNKQVDDDVLECLAEHCSQLESLLLEQTTITDQGIISLAPKLGSLKKLDISQCPQLTNVALKALTRHCPHLESLNLAMCKSITDAGFRSLIETCPELKEINLGGCYRLTSYSFNALAFLCPKLETVILMLVGSVTEADIQTLAQRCLNLKTVAISPNDWYRFLDSGFIEFLAKAHPNVRILSPLK